MSAFLATLRQIFHRPWMLAGLAAFSSAIVLLAGSFGVALQQMKQNESAQMNARGERFWSALNRSSASCAKAWTNAGATSARL